MPRRSLTGAFILFAFGTVGLSSLPLLETPRESPLHHPLNSWSVSLGFANDTIGSGHVGEWDDGRTAAVELLLRTPIPLYVEGSYAGFTRRSTAAEPVEARSDVIHFVVGLDLEGSIGRGRWRFMSGIGGLFFGNFMGHAGQSLVHVIVDQPRPIPPVSSYDAPATGFLLSGETGVTAPWGLPATASFSYAVSSLGYWEFSPSVGLVLAGPYNAARTDLRYQFLGAGGMPSSAADTLAQYEGLWLETLFTAHAVSVKYAWQPISKIFQGSLMFNISGGSQAFEGAQWRADYRLDYSLIIGRTGHVQRNAWTPRNWRFGRHSVAILLDLDSGYTPSDVDTARYQKSLLGAEWSFRIGEKVLFEPYGSVSLGYTFVRNYVSPVGGAAAEVLNDEWCFLTRCAMGARFFPFRQDKGSRYLRYGLTAGVLFDFDSRLSYSGNFRFHMGVSFRDEGIGGTGLRQ